MSVIVDVQGFKTDENKFIVKEIAVQFGSHHAVVLLFKPPSPFYNLSKSERKQVCWIERNRGIFWKEGFIQYKDHKKIIENLLQGNHRIFTKGKEKVTWIRELLNTSPDLYVYDLEDINCPSLTELYNKYKDLKDVYCCACHDKICALKNVLSLRKWCDHNKSF